MRTLPGRSPLSSQRSSRCTPTPAFIGPRAGDDLKHTTAHPAEPRVAVVLVVLTVAKRRHRERVRHGQQQRQSNRGNAYSKPPDSELKQCARNEGLSRYRGAAAADDRAAALACGRARGSLGEPSQLRRHRRFRPPPAARPGTSSFLLALLVSAALGQRTAARQRAAAASVPRAPDGAAVSSVPPASRPRVWPCRYKVPYNLYGFKHKIFSDFSKFSQSCPKLPTLLTAHGLGHFPRAPFLQNSPNSRNTVALYSGQKRVKTHSLSSEQRARPLPRSAGLHNPLCRAILTHTNLKYTRRLSHPGSS